MDVGEEMAEEKEKMLTAEQRRLKWDGYNLSNIITVDEKFVSLHQYSRGCNICSTIVISIPSAII